MCVRQICFFFLNYRFTYELVKVLKKNTECTDIVRVNLRKYCDYLNDCEVGREELNWRHFLKNQNDLVTGKMAFIFDGFEKVVQYYANIVISLFLQISKERESHSILVTSRPIAPNLHLKELQSQVSSLIFNFPLNFQDKNVFIII